MCTHTGECIYLVSAFIIWFILVIILLWYRKNYGKNRYISSLDTSLHFINMLNFNQNVWSSAVMYEHEMRSNAKLDQPFIPNWIHVFYWSLVRMKCIKICFDWISNCYDMTFFPDINADQNLLLFLCGTTRHFHLHCQFNLLMLWPYYTRLPNEMALLSMAAVACFSQADNSTSLEWKGPGLVRYSAWIRGSYDGSSELIRGSYNAWGYGRNHLKAHNQKLVAELVCKLATRGQCKYDLNKNLVGFIYSLSVHLTHWPLGDPFDHIWPLIPV